MSKNGIVLIEKISPYLLARGSHRLQPTAVPPPALLMGGLGGQHLTALGAAHLGLEHSLLQVVQVLAAAEDVLPAVLMINTLINNMQGAGRGRC
jgi:hypothetical protein